MTEPAPDTPSPRILLVEDDPTQRRTIGTVLSQAAFRVVDVDSVPAALEVLETSEAGTLDLVLCDLRLHERSGLELLQHMRRNDAHADTPFVIMSAHDTVEDRVAGFELDAAAVLHKPVAPTELRALVRSLVGREEARRRLQEEEKLRIVQRLASTVAHRINNPLTAVCTLPQALLHRRTDLPDDVRAMLEDLQEAGRRIEEVVRQLQLIRQVVESTYAGEIEMLDLDLDDEPGA